MHWNSAVIIITLETQSWNGLLKSSSTTTLFNITCPAHPPYHSLQAEVGEAPTTSQGHQTSLWAALKSIFLNLLPVYAHLTSLPIGNNLISLWQQGQQLSEVSLVFSTIYSFSHSFIHSTNSGWTATMWQVLTNTVNINTKKVIRSIGEGEGEKIYK